ncbi:hypothetical protein [Coleofasciculus sp. FACHB-1120]|uniref:hypothetical protein n=1 Tax=Coleofasciculus sp. FACHB-1120 TaxID=2692783 RepID=UPI001685E5FB|nr:hypothetical protein [Coleofasciculus sp. FACHB-1120]MBD2744374.1 hypothetical protein [Coleofasciculus sp. FACHB-1120]
MSRLNNRAFQILHTEVKKCAGNDALSQMEQRIVLEELEKLRSQPGSPASLEELRKIVIATYANFSQKALLAAAKANRPLGIFGKIKLAGCAVAGGAVLLVGGTGTLVLAILLSPTAHQPAGQNAPMSTEDRYQEAIASLDQAEELINQAKTAASLALGENKLSEAKTHIDYLPVSDTVSSRRHSYNRKGRRYVSGYDTQTIPNQQTANIRDRFEQIKSQLSQQQQILGRTNTLIQAAKQYAFAAAKTGQNPPHTAQRWQQGESLWYKAIAQLQNVRLEDVDYVEAQKLLVTYQMNLDTVQIRLKTERESHEAFNDAQQQINTLLASIPKDSSQVDRNQIVSQMQKIIHRLKMVKPGTSDYRETQQLLQSAQKKLKQAQPKS